MARGGDLDLIRRWTLWGQAGGLPATTTRLRRHYLTRLASDRPGLLEHSTDGLGEWLGGHDWSPNTRKSARSAVRSFYSWAVTVGALATSPADALPAVRVPRGRPKPAPEPAYRHALEDADPRLVLMVRLAGQLGLRRGEIARVAVEDLQPDLVGWSLRVRGKGGTVRMVPCPDELAREIQRRPAGWLFPSSARPGQPLTAGHVGKLLGEALPVGYAGHSLRHRCATAAYQATRDLLAVQALLGHAKPETTAGYVLPPSDAVRAAVTAASVAA